MSGYLDRQYSKINVSAFRGRKIIPFGDWSWMTTHNRDTLLDYLPATCAPFCESDVWCLDEGLQWLVDYHDWMVMRKDKLFADYVKRGMGALDWERIRQLIETDGDFEKVLAEEGRRGKARLCVVCQSPEVVNRYFNYAERKETRPPTHFCKERASLPENLWTTVTDMIEQDRRRSERLCAKCGSPKVVLRTDWETAPRARYSRHLQTVSPGGGGANVMGTGSRKRRSSEYRRLLHQAAPIGQFDCLRLGKSPHYELLDKTSLNQALCGGAGQLGMKSVCLICADNRTVFPTPSRGAT